MKTTLILSVLMGVTSAYGMNNALSSESSSSSGGMQSSLIASTRFLQPDPVITANGLLLKASITEEERDKCIKLLNDSKPIDLIQKLTTQSKQLAREHTELVLERNSRQESCTFYRDVQMKYGRMHQKVTREVEKISDELRTQRSLAQNLQKLNDGDLADHIRMTQIIQIFNALLLADTGTIDKETKEQELGKAKDLIFQLMVQPSISSSLTTVEETPLFEDDDNDKDSHGRLGELLNDDEKIDVDALDEVDQVASQAVETDTQKAQRELAESLIDEQGRLNKALEANAALIEFMQKEEEPYTAKIELLRKKLDEVTTTIEEKRGKVETHKELIEKLRRKPLNENVHSKELL